MVNGQFGGQFFQLYSFNQIRGKEKVVRAKEGEWSVVNFRQIILKIRSWRSLLRKTPLRPY